MIWNSNKTETLLFFLRTGFGVFYFFYLFIYLFSFLLTITLKSITVHVEIKIVNKEAATKRSTLLHAQRFDLIDLTGCRF